jgi:hypothetical protein
VLRGKITPRSTPRNNKEQREGIRKKVMKNVDETEGARYDLAREAAARNHLTLEDNIKNV